MSNKAPKSDVMTYASVTPMNHIKGVNENALAILVSSVISPTADFRTPMFPFRTPARALLITIPTRVCDRPKLVRDSVSPSRPVIKTGLRPIWSDNRPHCRTKVASATKKMDS